MDNKNDKDAYQDSVTAPMGREFNDDAGGDGNGSDEDMLAVGATLSEVLTAKIYPKFLNLRNDSAKLPQLNRCASHWKLSKP